MDPIFSPDAFTQEKEMLKNCNCIQPGKQNTEIFTTKPELCTTLIQCFFKPYTAVSIFKIFISNPFCRKTPNFHHKNYDTLYFYSSLTFILYFLPFGNLYPTLQSKQSPLQSLKHIVLVLKSRMFLLPGMPLTFSPRGTFLLTFKT